MKLQQHLLAIFFIFAATVLFGCKASNTNSPSTTNSSATDKTLTQPAETGIEKVKPAPGTGNVQGKVMYNSKPAQNIEVKLCETFNRFGGGCSGQSYMARTDREGEYVITNVAPKTYEALLASVFDTGSYVFATSGIAGISATKYEVTADRTLFISTTHLFKGDLKTLNPKAGAKVSSQNLELRWEPYPDVSYYKFSVLAYDSSIQSPYINERVEGTSFSIDKPLQNGTYRWRVEAFNKDDRKLTESADDIKFTVNDEAP